MSGTEKQTDRWLIVGALLVLLLAIGFLTFDDWLWGGRHDTGEVIGVVTSRDGDVRLKYEGDVKWQKAARGETLVYNDTIFAGAGSNANLRLGNSDLKVTENTLVVLRRQDNARYLNLTYGSLFGKIAKNDKILLDTGDGKTAVLSTATGSEVVLSKNNGKTEVQVVSGQVEMEQNGVKKKLTPHKALAQHKTPPKPPPPPPKPANFDVRALKPKAGDVFYSKDPIALNFQWTYGGNATAAAKDRFTIEFSKTPDFNPLFAQKIVDGKTTDVIHGKRSTELYYRVRGPKNQLSQTEKFKFVRMLPPNIITPKANDTYLAHRSKPASVPVQYEPAYGDPRYWTQISADSDFKTVLINQSDTKPVIAESLPSGAYYLRVRTDYGSDRLSDWSQPVPFQVKEKAVVPRLVFQNEILIPNKNYPQKLYGAPSADVQRYLASQGFMGNYFSSLNGHADKIVLDYMDGKRPESSALNWPEQRIIPETYKYRYQLIKKGQLPSSWSAPEKLKIADEAPRDTTPRDPRVGDLTKDGRIPVKLHFTPLLFASSYEVQMSRNADFSEAKDVNVKKPEVGFYANRKSTYYWHARGLNDKGVPISAYSSPSRLDTGSMEPAILQAMREKEKSRQPAADEESRMKMASSFHGRTFENSHHGFWMWAGSGMNFVDYNQSIPGRGTFDSKSLEPVGAYLEVGWGDPTWGAVVSYKNLPGNMKMTNATVDNPNYSWQTIAAEGLFCPIPQKTLFGYPAQVGLRAGFQYHEMPFAFLNKSNAVVMEQINMMNASLGIDAEWSKDRWRYYWQMRYQYPLVSALSGTSITPTFAFDGLVGSAYYISDNWKLGLFWYGQWQQFNFNSSDGQITNAGSQMIFYSAMDLRIGYDF